MSLLSPELQSKVAIWRLKCDAGTITMPEMREAVNALRQGRLNAGNAAKASGIRKAKGPSKSAEDMLSELGGL